MNVLRAGLHRAALASARTCSVRSTGGTLYHTAVRALPVCGSARLLASQAAASSAAAGRPPATAAVAQLQLQAAHNTTQPNWLVGAAGLALAGVLASTVSGDGNGSNTVKCSGDTTVAAFPQVSRKDAKLQHGVSNGLADVVAACMPSIVRVRPIVDAGLVVAGNGQGTGFIVHSDGLIVTNRHVAESAKDAASRVSVRQPCNVSAPNFIESHVDWVLFF